ncbi:MAG: hypothetical protein V4591_08490 [Bdellovibrionota bacterium]
MKNQPPPLSSLILPPNYEYTFHQDKLALALSILHSYACGMCGKQFKDLGATWECVTNDVHKLTSFPIREVNSHEICYFKCLLCTKNYVNIEDMAKCLTNDLERKNLPVALKEHLNNVVLKTLEGKKSTNRNPLFSTHSILKIPIKLSPNPMNSIKKSSKTNNKEVIEPQQATEVKTLPTTQKEKEIHVLGQEEYSNTASDITETPKFD